MSDMLRKVGGLLILMALSCGSDGVPLPGPVGSGGGPENCDVDDDGLASVECGGLDCCDLDPTVPSHSEDYRVPTNECGSWDWDCDGVEALEHGVLDCEGFTVDTCDGQRGWFGPELPSCGEVAAAAFCAYSYSDSMCRRHSLSDKPVKCR